MLPKDAINILGLGSVFTEEELKSAHRVAAKKYHPDINPAGLQMMKMINAAFDTLKDYDGDPIAADAESCGYPEELSEALNAIIDLPGLDIEICGSWVWVGGDTRTHKAALKEAGFKWAAKKKKWNFRPAGWKSKSRGRFSMDEIRDTYGSTKPAYQGRTALPGAA